MGHSAGGWPFSVWQRRLLTCFESSPSRLFTAIFSVSPPWASLSVNCRAGSRCRCRCSARAYRCQNQLEAGLRVMTCGTLVYFPQSFIGIVWHQQLAVREAAVGVVSGLPAGAASGGRTALVFSVFRFLSSLSAIAWSAAFRTAPRDTWRCRRRPEKGAASLCKFRGDRGQT
jgi:hypothetical protein